MKAYVSRTSPKHKHDKVDCLETVREEEGLTVFMPVSLPSCPGTEQVFDCVREAVKLEKI